MNRQNRVVSPGGTISRSVFDLRNLLVSSWVGTNDALATDAHPDAGGGHPGGNNMVIVTGNVYDGGSAGGNGNVTSRTNYLDATGALDRTTGFLYDFRNRQIQINLPIDSYQVTTYDNLDRVTQVDRFSQATNLLIARSKTNFDNLGRAFQQITVAVDPSSGATGNSLVDNTWFDPSGNVAKRLSAGASTAYTKTQYDSVSRTSASYTGYSPGSNDNPWTIGANDRIFEQSVPTYDAASNVLLSSMFQRNQGDTTTTGALVNTNARMSYTGFWYDGVGRQIAAANYGTNGTSLPPSLLASPPPSSEAVLVSLTQYNERGEAFLRSDPASKVTRIDADDAGRTIRATDNYISLVPCATCGAAGPCDCDPCAGSSEGSCPQPGNDQNVMVETWHNADGLVLTMTARNPVTGDQTTRYQYGTTLDDSAVARNDLLVAEIYPDSVDAADRVTHAYNRQGERTKTRDQNGTVHSYSHDKLARLTDDTVTTFGAGVDNLVSRINTTYEVRGLVEHVKSYSGSTVANDVLRQYNSFQQLSTEHQEHNGAVVVGSSLKAQYAYENGSANTIRRTSMTYPYSTGGRTLTYVFNSGDDSALSRVSSLSFGGSTVAEYAYFGLASFASTSYAARSFGSVLAIGSSDPGFDRFGRVVDLRWTNTTTGDLARIQYGYDPASNRTYRRDVLAHAAGKSFDEIYAYDRMQRLVGASRGRLADDNSRLDSSTFRQTWGLDATGNWREFSEFDTQTSTFSALDQQRTSNTANEITAIGASVGPVWQTPAYDRNGNMTTVPEPTDMTLAADATWDAWNRLVKYQDSSGNYHNSLYDGLNRRVLHVEADTPRAYIYSDQWQVLEERVIPFSDSDRQFVWGLRYIDDLVFRDRQPDDSGSLSERLYALQDANWNVTAIVGDTGAVQERYAYTAYGAPLFLGATFDPFNGDGSAFGWETLYSGYRHDSLLGVYMVRNRGLQPRLGAWLRRDSAWITDAANLYGYVSSTPLSSLDPSGRKKCCVSSVTRRILKPLDFYVTKEHGGFLGFQFSLDAKFCPECECCEFRQHVMSQIYVWGMNAAEGEKSFHFLNEAAPRGGTDDRGRTFYIEDKDETGRAMDTVATRESKSITTLLRANIIWPTGLAYRG